MSQLPDLNPIEPLWEILEQYLRKNFPQSSTKLQLIEFLVEEWCRIPPIEFPTPVESMPRCIKAGMACRDPTPYNDALWWYFLYFVCVNVTQTSPIHLRDCQIS